MSLRTKCAILILAFELVLAATLVLTVRYIGTYFENAAAAFTTSSGALADLNRLRSLVRNEFTHLLQFDHYADTPSECPFCLEYAQEIEAAMSSVYANLPSPANPGQARQLRSCNKRRAAAVASHFDAIKAAGDPATVQFDETAHLAMDRFLGTLQAQLQSRAHHAVESPYLVQQRAILILSANAVVAAVMGIAGLVLVRRWVLSPIQELKRVTDEIGKGNLDDRVSITSHDELGQLAAAINKMSADLTRIEKQMIQRERQIAMGELISRVAHNIRNPLAGIQASTEATRRQLSEDSPLRAHQDAIVAAIEKFQRWLRELEHTCSPLEVNFTPSDLREVIEDVVAVFRPMADRRSIEIELDLGNGPVQVNIDARHLEQALAAVVGNAIEVAGEKAKVVIGAENADDTGHWCLTVTDTGPGIPSDVIGKIFEPSFTTKRSGHGLGLALARKIVELHGGHISVECPPDGGTIFKMTMPIQPDSRTSTWQTS